MYQSHVGRTTGFWDYVFLSTLYFLELFSSVLGEPLRTLLPYTSSTLYSMKLITRAPPHTLV